MIPPTTPFNTHLETVASCVSDCDCRCRYCNVTLRSCSKIEEHDSLAAESRCVGFIELY
ncbi:hypothetical protein BC629DRAFT_1551450 [Irpex lacteus]|nr:hypothetical protein BC629DRAFT_1551450 [Irpex lacteus]